MKSFLSEISDDFVSLIYPHVCEGCLGPLVKGEDILCTSCLSDLPRANMHIDGNNPLAEKFKGRIPVIAAAAFLRFRKRGKVQRMLHSLKYRNRPEIGYKLGYAYGHDLVQAGFSDRFDLIISVPLHPSRLRSRGYNQSDEWARGISDSTAIPFRSGLLQRLRNTRTQTDRSKLGRWENVREVFTVAYPDQVRDKAILLADDVVTTGATLESCGQVLLNSGCRGFGVACIAMAQ
ncbi:MAG TPA: ComF family protein [Cyclobacteriaceae bacterium]|jgi:ComF family protein